MVSQSLLPGFKPPAFSGKSRRRERSKISKSGGEANNVILWPEFKISTPDPVLGEIFSGKGSLTPEQTLVEFVSTSASFHGVKKQPLRTLEWDLLKVFPSNVMPANAAAWYMAKRKFYMDQSFDQQLLPYVLKKYPERFKIIGTQVVFLEVYSQEVAKNKMKFLTQYGMHAYFSHKAEEYGVYFFDPFYYENTEPFHESLRQCNSNPNMPNKSKLVSSYFNSAALKGQFKFQQHSTYLVSICKQPGVKIVTNTTGVIVSMINNQYGFIKFGAGETALFCCKSLFKDGWQFSGDPLRLPAMKFDGYQIPEGGVRGEQAYSWYAVLVWCGRRPSPKFCSTAEDLNSTPVFREGRIRKLSIGGSPVEGIEGKKLRQPSSSMMVGQVMEIRRNGAVLKVRDDCNDKVFIPGWKRQLSNSSGLWLSSLSGECIGLGDLVAYYVDTVESRPGFTAVGKNVMVLKESGEDVQRRRRRRKSTEASAGAVYQADSDRDGKSVLSDAESECGVTDGELEWLDMDIGSMIKNEDPRAKTLKLLKDVQNQLGQVRGRKDGSGPMRKGPDKMFKAGYSPIENSRDSFWRMNKLFVSVDAGYISENDPDYEPGDEVEFVRGPRRVSGTSDSLLGTSSASDVKRVKDAEVNVDKRSDRVRAESSGKTLPYWVRAVSLPEKFDAEFGKFVPLDGYYNEMRDPDYVLPETDVDIEESEVDDLDCEIEDLKKAASEELSVELKDKVHWQKVVSPVKIIVTPSKEGTEEVKDEVVQLDSETDGSVIKDTPVLWVKELVLHEQSEEYDSSEDPEYVPPSIIYETDQEYDEYSDGGDEISAEELIDLQSDQKSFNPPANYISIWVPITSPAEKIARAKEQLISECKEASGAETSGKDTDSNSNDVGNVSKLKREDLVKETGLTPMMSSLNVSPGADKLKPKQKRVRKMSKGKGRGSSSSDGNVEPASNEIVADENVSTTVGAPCSKDSTVKSCNDKELEVEVGDDEKDGKTSDTKRDILTSPIKQYSRGENDNVEGKVSAGSSKKGKMDKKSPGKVNTPEKN